MPQTAAKDKEITVPKDAIIGRYQNSGQQDLIQVVGQGNNILWRLTQTGSTWFSGIGNSGVFDGQLAGNLYLDAASGNIWQFNGTAWSPITTQIAPQSLGIRVLKGSGLGDYHITAAYPSTQYVDTTNLETIITVPIGSYLLITVSLQTYAKGTGSPSFTAPGFYMYDSVPGGFLDVEDITNYAVTSTLSGLTLSYTSFSCVVVSDGLSHLLSLAAQQLIVSGDDFYIVNRSRLLPSYSSSDNS